MAKGISFKKFAERAGKLNKITIIRIRTGPVGRMARFETVTVQPELEPVRPKTRIIRGLKRVAGNLPQIRAQKSRIVVPKVSAFCEARDRTRIKALSLEG